MSDRLVVDGDRTTTGGEVIGRSDFYNEEGKMYARKENHATCGNCKGGWPIYGTAGNWMDDGLPYVKDLDWVMCPCRKNRVLAAGSSNAFYSETRESVETEKTPAPLNDTYDERFTLRDGKGRALADTYYTIRLQDDELIYGTTDSAGRTARHTTDGAKRVRIYLGRREFA